MSSAKLIITIKKKVSDDTKITNCQLPDKYHMLNKMPNTWCECLHDDYCTDSTIIKLDGLNFASVSHYISYNVINGLLKSSLVNRDRKKITHIRDSLTLNSNSEISRKDGTYAKLESEKYEDNGAIRYWRLRALYSKYWQNSDIRDILIETRGIILNYQEKNYINPVIDEDMMLVRDYLCMELNIDYISKNILLSNVIGLSHEDQFIWCVFADRCQLDKFKLPKIKL